MHVYERNFPAANDASLIIPAGNTKACFELDFPHAAIITKLIVKQKSGTSLDFSVNLYNRQICTPAFDEDGSSIGDGYSAVTDALAKVILTQAATAGNAMELFAPDATAGGGGAGWSFRNMDAEGTFTVPIRKIYLEVIHAEMQGDTEWEVAIACLPRL